MTQSEQASGPSLVAIHLLDSALGRTLRSWEFREKKLISIGRAEERHVQIDDPYVSRIHAELRLEPQGWILVSLGRSGVLMQGKSIEQIALTGETTFRLGPEGPTLRFDPAAARADNRMTMMFDSTVMENVFDLDKSKLEREVSDIAEGNYFKELQKRAAHLPMCASEPDIHHGDTEARSLKKVEGRIRKQNELIR